MVRERNSEMKLKREKCNRCKSYLRLGHAQELQLPKNDGDGGRTRVCDCF